MRTRFPAPVFCLLATAAMTVALALPAAAQPQPNLPTPEKQAPIVAPKDLPHVPRGNRLQDLEFLFGALKAAPDEQTAKAVEQRIWAVWVISRSDTTNLLMTRVRTAVEAKDNDLAIKLLDSIVKIKPDYLEGWNRRATLYYSQKDYGRALADIREVLKREPRHFGALAGLGMILQDIGDDKQALEVYRRALAVYPKLQRIPDLVKTLQEKVEGRDI